MLSELNDLAELLTKQAAIALPDGLHLYMKVWLSFACILPGLHFSLQCTARFKRQNADTLNTFCCNFRSWSIKFFCLLKALRIAEQLMSWGASLPLYFMLDQVNAVEVYSLKATIQGLSRHASLRSRSVGMQMNKAARLQFSVDRQTVALLGEGTIFNALHVELRQNYTGLVNNRTDMCSWSICAPFWSFKDLRASSLLLSHRIVNDMPLDGLFQEMKGILLCQAVV